jgi:hypothetical protein
MIYWGLGPEENSGFANTTLMCYAAFNTPVFSISI